MYYYDSTYLLILVPFFILSAFVSNKLKSKFKNSLNKHYQLIYLVKKLLKKC